MAAADDSEEFRKLVQIDSISRPFIYGNIWLLSRPFGRGKEEISANWLISRPLWIIIKLTYFKTLGSYTALNCSNELLSRPQHSPWETTSKLTVLNLHGKLLSTKIGSFRTISHSESWTHVKTPALLKQCFHFPWETSLEKLTLSRPFCTVNFRLISRHLWIIHHIQWMDSFQDRSEEEKNTEHTAAQF